MDYKKNYQMWLESPLVDEETKAELRAITDENEIKDRFYKNLEFGTAGLRGKLGAGTNRMNKYNVAKVTQGIANYIKKHGQERMDRGVTIAYDCRHFSPEFAKLAALIFAGNGIKAYLYESLRPTPQLSYTLLQKNATSGIIITASHNPKDYNGYKVYWDDGAQVLQNIADGMTEEILALPLFGAAKIMDEKEALEKGLLEMLTPADDDAYINMVKSQAIRDEEVDKSAKIVYTPLNGAGSVAVRRVLKEMGYTNVSVVPEQRDPDPNFTTVEYPNPEDPKAFEYAEKLGKEVDAELLIATDPDSDRLAIEVRDKDGNYIPFNGNQIGAILINYIVTSLHEKNLLPKNPCIVKSIVTGDMGADIAKKFGVTTFPALTGFKNICGRIDELAEKGYTYIFGYEESIGYTYGSTVRDKDGVSSAMLLCEAAGYYKKQGKTLFDIVGEMYETYGYYKEKVVSLVLEGVEGAERIKRMMAEYRNIYPKTIGSMELEEVIDYNGGYKDVPSSNVLKFLMKDGSWYAVRPSGTEPKIKIYIYTRDDKEEVSTEKLALIEKTVIDTLQSIK